MALLTPAQHEAIREVRDIFSWIGGKTSVPADNYMRVNARTVFHLLEAVESLSMRLTNSAPREVPLPAAEPPSPSPPTKPAPRTRPAPAVDPYLPPTTYSHEPYPMLDIPPQLAIKFASAWIAFEKGEISYAELEGVMNEVKQTVAVHA
jgi:hypothetical protein